MGAEIELLNANESLYALDSAIRQVVFSACDPGAEKMRRAEKSASVLLNDFHEYKRAIL